MYEKTLNRRNIFAGDILDLDLLEVELEDGRTSRREVVRHRGAVGILAFRPDGKLLLVRQFRKATEHYCLEIAAGLLEEGESAEECARRELLEETGYGAVSMRKLGEVELSPGYSDERIELFYAEVGDARDEQALDDDEHVEVIAFSRAEFRERLKRAEIEDGKTLAAWLLYEKIIAEETPGVHLGG